MRVSNNKRVIKFMISFLFVLFVSLFVSYNSLAEGEDEYIEIRTAKDLYNIRNNMSGKYKLMNDIDLSEVTAEGGLYDFQGRGWNPIGSDDQYSNIPFTGVFDGQGYTISGIRFYVNNKTIASDEYYGLFSCNDGVIKNLKLSELNYYVSVRLKKKYLRVGGLVAVNNGTISNVSVENGTIEGRIEYTTRDKYDNYKYYSFISGIASNYGVMNDCFNGADVTAKGTYYDVTYVGGSFCTALAYPVAGGVSADGGNGSVFNRCCNSGNISGEKMDEGHSWYASAIDKYGIGKTGTICDCFNMDENTDSNYFGIAGSGTLTNCYYIGKGKPQSSGTATNCYYYLGKGTAGTGWIGLNEEQMKDASFFEGFDFDDTWTIAEEGAYKYPQLKGDSNAVRIEIVSFPNKLEYVEGQEFDPTGLAVNTVYNNGESVECTDYELSDVDKTVGEKTVTITYGELSTTFNVDYIAKQIKEIVVSQPPNKVVYNDGEPFDNTGMIVTAIYNDNSEVEITDYLVSDINGYGSVDITVSYEDYSATLSVFVWKDAPDHNYGEITYTWNEDYSSCHAYAKCTCCDIPYESEEDAEVTSSVKEEQTCEAFGVTTYIATFTKAPFSSQKKDVRNLEPLGHLKGQAIKENFIEPTCAEKGAYDEVIKCTRCNKEISRNKVLVDIDYSKHKWEEWKETKAPTKSTEGEETRVCAICNSKETRSIPKTESSDDTSSDKISYRYIDGGEKNWYKGSKNFLSFTFKRSENDNETFDHFSGISVDNTFIDKSNYNSKSGSVIIDIKPEYLETLSVGEHTLGASFDDGGTVFVKFNVQLANNEKGIEDNKQGSSNNVNNTVVKSSTNPNTSDETKIALCLMMLVTSFVLSMIIIKKYKTTLFFE